MMALNKLDVIGDIQSSSSFVKITLEIKKWNFSKQILLWRQLNPVQRHRNFSKFSKQCPV